MKGYITNEEKQTFQAFAQAQMARDGVSFEEANAGFVHDFSKMWEGCSEKYPTLTAGMTTTADFFGVTKLENLDPMVAKNKSTGELTIDGIVAGMGASTLLLPGSGKLAESLAEKLTKEVSPAAAKAGLTTVESMIDTLTTERGGPLVEKLANQLEKSGLPAGGRELVVGTLKGLMEKSVPDEAAKKAVEMLLDKANERADHELNAGRDAGLDNKVKYTHEEQGQHRSHTGKIVGVYPNEKNPQFAVMHSTDDRYYKFTPSEWGGGDKNVGAPSKGSIVTIENGAALDVVGHTNTEIAQFNKASGMAPLPGVKDVELFESSHPPKNRQGTVVVVGDSVMIHTGRGNYILAEKNDLGTQSIKTGDFVQFDARGNVNVQSAEQSLTQTHALQR
jgi:hypothetical protein